MNNINSQFQDIKALLAQLESDVASRTSRDGCDPGALAEVAFLAVRMYAEMHPRPPHVTQKQAAEMVHVSESTMSKMVRSGRIKINGFGQIAISEIDRLLAIV